MEPTVTKPTVPTSWPGAFGAFKPSKAVVWFNLKTMLILFVISIAIGAVPSLFGLDENFGAQLISNLLILAVGIATTVALLAGIRGKKVSLDNAFAPILSMTFVNSILLYIVAGFLLLVSFLLLIVPFFFVLPRLALSPILLIDKKLGPIDAVKQSWALTKGHAGKIWGVIGVTLLFTVLIVVIVGLYLLFIYQAALILLYAYVLKQSRRKPEHE